MAISLALVDYGRWRRPRAFLLQIRVDLQIRIDHLDVSKTQLRKLAMAQGRPPRSVALLASSHSGWWRNTLSRAKCLGSRCCCCCEGPPGWRPRHCPARHSSVAKSISSTAIFVRGHALMHISRSRPSWLATVARPTTPCLGSSRLRNPPGCKRTDGSPRSPTATLPAGLTSGNGQVWIRATQRPRSSASSTACTVARHAHTSSISESTCSSGLDGSDDSSVNRCWLSTRWPSPVLPRYQLSGSDKLDRET